MLAAALSGVEVRSVGAQESFFNERYCSQTTGSGPGTGIPNCSFHTWQQCIASARGLGRYCMENPFNNGRLRQREHGPWRPDSQRRSGGLRTGNVRFR